MDTTLREILNFHPMHLAGAHGIGQPPMKCSKCAIAYLLARLEKAEAVCALASQQGVSGFSPQMLTDAFTAWQEVQ